MTSPTFRSLPNMFRPAGRLPWLLILALVALVAPVVPSRAVGSAHPRLPTVRRANTCPASKRVRHTAPGSGRTVALTFDDGPGRSTKEILVILKLHHVTATFFNIGEQMDAGRSLLRREYADGDALGNHTWDHHDLADLGQAEQERELDRTSKKQKHLVGAMPCLLRPPFGTYDHTTLKLAAERHLAVWLWSVDTEDWKAEGSASASWVDRITSRAEAGVSQTHPVILMHDPEGGEPATVQALPAIISFYQSHHYTFVNLLDRARHGSRARVAGGGRVRPDRAGHG